MPGKCREISKGKIPADMSVYLRYQHQHGGLKCSELVQITPSTLQGVYTDMQINQLEIYLQETIPNQKQADQEYLHSGMNGRLLGNFTC